MAQKLKDANPEAFKNVVGRLIEASNRGMWNAAPEVRFSRENYCLMYSLEVWRLPLISFGLLISQLSIGCRCLSWKIYHFICLCVMVSRIFENCFIFVDNHRFLTESEGPKCNGEVWTCFSRKYYFELECRHAQVLEKLQDLYSDLDDTIEMGTSARPQLQFDRMDDRRIYWVHGAQELCNTLKSYVLGAWISFLGCGSISSAIQVFIPLKIRIWVRFICNVPLGSSVESPRQKRQNNWNPTSKSHAYHVRARRS